MINKGMDDVKALFALFAMAMFSNALDQRTYMPFQHTIDKPSTNEREEQWKIDLNAIPLLERRHYSYTRGLAFDLLHWFFNRFGFSKPNQETDDAYTCLLAPFTAELGRKMVTYKFSAEKNKYRGVCTAEKFEHQVQKAIFCFDGMQDAYDNVEDDIDEPDPSFAFEFDDYDVAEYDVLPHDSVQHFYRSIDDFFDFGKNDADHAYFDSL
jgi:hypothetical protein